MFLECNLSNLKGLNIPVLLCANKFQDMLFWDDLSWVEVAIFEFLAQFGQNRKTS